MTSFKETENNYSVYTYTTYQKVPGWLYFPKSSYTLLDIIEELANDLQIQTEQVDYWHKKVTKIHELSEP